MVAAIPKLNGAKVQCIHLSGPSDAQMLRDAYAAAGIPAWVEPFFHEMEKAYSAADFAIARSGAASLTELSYYGIASILIPYPHAAEDHQTLNARIFERAGAALLIPEKDGTRFASELAAVLQDERRMQEMGEKASALAAKDAAARVAETILTFCHR
jgi:UDP-N-acetylglucosamine--N-acetylmuramyl-(pentapeptide) pyrophosphoryl-undecaprenol N-acetylglucosamine transferase